MPAVRPPYPLRSLIVAVTAVVVVPLVGVSVASAAVDTVTGDLVRTVVGGAASGNPPAMELAWVRADTGDTVRVWAGKVYDIPTGSRVRLTLGTNVDDAGDYVLAPARDVLDREVLDGPPDSGPGISGGGVTNEVTVVPVLAAGATPDMYLNFADLLASLNGPVHDYWAEQTGGAVQIHASGDPSWVSTTAPCSDPFAMWDEAADAVDWQPGPGKHLLLYVSSYGVGSWPCDQAMAESGLGLDWGGVSYVRGGGDARLARMLGHNLGLGLSRSTGCLSDVHWGGCTWRPEGDWYDAMGVGVGQLGSLNPAQAAALGTLPESAVETVSLFGSGATGRSYTLQPYGGQAGVRTLKITDQKETTWLEFRAATGRDAWLADPAKNTQQLQTGVLLRQGVTPGTTTSTGLDAASYLLDGTPSGDPADRQVALPVGKEVWVGGVYVRVESVAPSAATVRIRNSYALSAAAGDDACTRWPTVPMSQVALLSDDRRFGAFVVGLDRALWFRPIDGDPSSWRSLGGGALYGPAAAAAGSTSYVFVVGLDGSLFYRADDGSGWGRWTTLGGYLTASPAAASLGEGHVRVFGRGLDGQMWSRELRNGTWSDWIPHGGYLTAAPSATAHPDEGRVEVYARGTDGWFYSQSLPEGSEALPYQRRALVGCSPPALPSVQRPSDPAVGASVNSLGWPLIVDSHAYWFIGGVVTSTPAVAFSGAQFVLVGRGTDGALWLYDGRGRDAGWHSLGGYILN